MSLDIPLTGHYGLSQARRKSLDFG